MEKFVRPEVLSENSSIKAMMRIDLKKEGNLLQVDKLKIGHSANQILRKATTVHRLEVRKFKTAARSFLVT